MKNRYVTIPWLLKQQTRHLKSTAEWLATRPHCYPGYDDVIDALVGLIVEELRSRDPRRKQPWRPETHTKGVDRGR